VCATARARSKHLTRNQQAVGPLTGLEIVFANPRPGLRRWVFSTLPLRTGREIYTELHHDGSTVLAVNLSWKALRADDTADRAVHGLLVDADIVGASCRDALAHARLRTLFVRQARVAECLLGRVPSSAVLPAACSGSRMSFMMLVALELAEFQRLVLAAVDPYIDGDVLARQIAREEEQRRALAAFLDGWDAAGGGVPA
jgi:hypothetical protein